MKLVSEMLLSVLRARTHHEIQFFRLVVAFIKAEKESKKSLFHFDSFLSTANHQNVPKISVDSFPSQDLFLYLITHH